MSRRAVRPHAGHGAATLRLPPRPDTTGEPDWLRQRRDEAWQAFEAAELPERKHPRWRTFDPTPFLTAEPVIPAAPAGLAQRVAGYAVDGLPHRVVLVDGRFRPDLSNGPDGLRLLPLASDDEVPRFHLHQTAEAADQDAASLLNMALWQDGVLIDVQPKTAVAVHVLHLRTAPGASFDRVLVHVQDGGRLTMFQEFAGDGASCAVTELQAHAGATIHRDLFQDAPVLHTTFSRAEGNATVRDVQVHMAPGRNTSVARVAGAGAHVELAGLYLAAGSQASDHWTRVDHAVADGTSHELYKGVLAGSAHTSFTGSVIVRAGAQRTSAEQQNRNLLLSRKALAESTPQLEIHADDVKCSHGSTVGRIDEDALFFLQSRGIGRDAARVMLTKAFAAEVIDMLAVTAVRQAVLARIEEWFRDAEVA